jgi:hypothetical protein
LSSYSNEKRHNVSFCLSHTYVFAGIFALCKTAPSVMRLHVIQLWAIISSILLKFFRKSGTWPRRSCNDKFIRVTLH